MFYEISNWPPKINSSDCQMFLCVSAWESGLGREERKECILRKTNWLETGRQSKQPQTSRSQQGLFKQREFIIQRGRSRLTGFTKPHLNRRLSVKVRGLCYPCPHWIKAFCFHYPTRSSRKSDMRYSHTMHLL